MDPKNNPNYGNTEKSYKSKFICLNCRKAFKRILLSDITKDESTPKPPKCPECGKPTFWIGRKFRAPKSDDIKSWNSIRIMNELGIYHFSGWATIPVTIPNSEKKLRELLVRIKTALAGSPSFSKQVKSIEKYLAK